MLHTETHTHREGESYRTILWYFWPELITALVVYSLMTLFDSWLIAGLHKTTAYATLMVTNTLTQFLSKVAEGLMVGSVVLCGHYNGRGDNRNVGVAMVSSLWATLLLGTMISVFLYFGAAWIYGLYGVPAEMAQMGVPFLRTRAIGIFFMFLAFAFVGFLRGIKNTRVPMVLYVLGGTTFMFFDWALVQGHCGFSAQAFQGSAQAFMIQYMVMCLGAALYLLFNKKVRMYSINMISSFRATTAREILRLSLPIMLDKATVAWSKIWLVPLLATAGVGAIASYGTLKNLVQLAFVPAMAFAQVITLLVSNDVSAGNWSGVKHNIKRVLFLTIGFSVVVLLIFILNAHTLVQYFDKEGTFTDFTVSIFPIMAALSLFDIFQIVLAAALRGAGDVRVLMLIRVISCLVFFLPVSTLFSRLSIDSPAVKFVLIYSVFYITNGLTSLFYVKRLAGKEWHLRFLQSKKTDR